MPAVMEILAFLGVSFDIMDKSLLSYNCQNVTIH